MRNSIQKVLIANRGEIACRIIQTLEQMGIESVAVYSDADRNALHVEKATEAVHIGPSPANESYLRIDRLIAAAKQTGADAIHPGYGFLSENPAFAEACQLNNIVFIGPPPSAIRAMGSKSAAKRIMERSGVPLIPGYHGEDQDDHVLKMEANRTGYPVILKAALGGGGKGMRIVRADAEFDEALASCRREAQASFNDSTILIEKYIEQPRHVEIQIFCDHHGNAVHLFDRDCSIQRRHQKIIEEAPAPNIPQVVREKMASDAILAAKAIDYVGAGTVEFLYDGKDRYYFMEMNTRLQVEHPVTEMVTDIDLVKWQIDVARGQPIPLQQSDIRCTGHSIEVRLCAEDCNQNFMPSTGPLTIVRTPKGSTAVRLDSGVYTEDTISVYYDPMFAKLVAWGRDRTEAIRKTLTSLQNMCIAGVETNISYAYGILNSEEFKSADLTTHFINSYEFASPSIEMVKEAMIAASLYRIKAMKSQAIPLPYSWRLNSARTDIFNLECTQIKRSISVTLLDNSFNLEIDEEVYTVAVACNADAITLNGDISGRWFVYAEDGNLHLFKDAIYFRVTDSANIHSFEDSSNENKYTSPMPGVITKLFVEEGDVVEEGMPLVVVEAMKMEHIINSRSAGTIESILCGVGGSVIVGEEILRMGV